RRQEPRRRPVAAPFAQARVTFPRRSSPSGETRDTKSSCDLGVAAPASGYPHPPFGREANAASRAAATEANSVSTARACAPPAGSPAPRPPRAPQRGAPPGGRVGGDRGGRRRRGGGGGRAERGPPRRRSVGKGRDDGTTHDGHLVRDRRGRGLLGGAGEVALS